ncbi:MAG TPA: hypothetical protein VI216_11155 [Candidatus Acidoferrales bacterium]
MPTSKSDSSTASAGIHRKERGGWKEKNRQTPLGMTTRGQAYIEECEKPRPVKAGLAT